MWRALRDSDTCLYCNVQRRSASLAQHFKMRLCGNHSNKMKSCKALFQRVCPCVGSSNCTSVSSCALASRDRFTVVNASTMHGTVPIQERSSALIPGGSSPFVSLGLRLLGP
eukprot:3022269-Amphidinium_carterae.1